MSSGICHCHHVSLLRHLSPEKTIATASVTKWANDIANCSFTIIILMKIGDWTPVDSFQDEGKHAL